MPKVSGLIVPNLCHRCHDGNIRCLEPVAPFANHHDYSSGEDEEAQNKEEPEEPLGIVTEVTAIIFLVAFLNLPAFLNKHGIDLTDTLLHLDGKYYPEDRLLRAMVFDYDALVKTYGQQLLEKGGAEQENTSSPPPTKPEEQVLPF